MCSKSKRIVSEMQILGRTTSASNDYEKLITYKKNQRTRITIINSLIHKYFIPVLLACDYYDDRYNIIYRTHFN